METELDHILRKDPRMCCSCRVDENGKWEDQRQRGEVEVERNKTGCNSWNTARRGLQTATRGRHGES